MRQQADPEALLGLPDLRAEGWLRDEQLFRDARDVRLVMLAK
jgi:hypothetical protein